jgi:hypothetical protein
VTAPEKSLLMTVSMPSGRAERLSWWLVRPADQKGVVVLSVSVKERRTLVVMADR